MRMCMWVCIFVCTCPILKVQKKITWRIASSFMCMRNVWGSGQTLLNSTYGIHIVVLSMQHGRFAQSVSPALSQYRRFRRKLHGVLPVRLFVCACVYVFLYVYACMHAFMYMWKITCVSVSMWVQERCIHIRAHACMHACMYVCMDVWMYVCIRGMQQGRAYSHRYSEKN
jgi:hypothetical protein